MISQEDRDRVRAATDLVELVQETVPLRQRGQEFWGCCPFHDEKTPSFHIIPATQVWHCFGCGEGGDCFTYVMKRENLSFPEAIRYLADRAGIEIHDDFTVKQGSKRSRLIEVCEATSKFYHTMLMRGKDNRPRDYFASRGMGGAICKRYRLGFAPGRGSLVTYLHEQGFVDQEMIDANVAVHRDRGLADRFYDRVMFPIFDERGACIAFGGRVMGKGEPKYLNTAETALFHKARNLYGFNWAKDHIISEGCAIVVEGYTDAIACWEAGIGNVVATLGTALTASHVKTLTRFAKKIIYLFDGDAAGQKAAERAIQFVESPNLDLRCVVLPDGKDPMEFITAEGGDALCERLKASEPLLDFVFRKLEARSNLSTPGGRTKALEDACRLIYPLRQSYMIDSYYVQIADRVGLDVDNVRDAAKRVFREIRHEEEQRERRERERVTHANSPKQSSLVSSSKSQESELSINSAPQYDTSVIASTQPVILTDLERQSLTCERELLTCLTAEPDVFRAYADRIVDIDWVDQRHQTIAWAVLATPEGTAPQDVMSAVRSLCPDADSLVGAGSLSVTSSFSTDVNVKFLLDTLELLTVRRRLKAVQAKLRSNTTSDPSERRLLTIDATKAAARLHELEKELEGVADPFAAQLSDRTSTPSSHLQQSAESSIDNSVPPV